MMPPPTLQQRLAERTRPSGPVVMLQRWEQLLFLHWSRDPAEVQRTLPPGLTVDTHDGFAWLGIVPLFMREVRPRFVPSVALLADFLELNTRTYVFDAKGRPGVFFYSLDCNQPVAVEAARRLLLLRYEHAAIEAELDGEGWVDFSAQRKEWPMVARYRYHAYGPPAAPATSESLEFFLIERYRLFAADADGEQLNSIRVCHAPHLIRQGQVTEWSDGPLRLAGFDLRGRAPDHICTAEPVEVETFTPERVEL
jgi:uncharacterized protein